MPVGDIIESTIVVWTGTQNMLNVLHWRVQTVGGTEPTAQEKANAISGFMATDLKLIMSTGDTFKGIKYRLLAPSPTAVIISTTSAGTGTRAGDQLPSQLSGLLSLRSSLAPPRVRGRMYLPRVVEADNAGNGTPTAGYLADMATFGAAIFQSHTLTGSAGNVTVMPVIYRKPPVSTFYQITQVLVRPAWATQRRRSQINRGDTSAI